MYNPHLNLQVISPSLKAKKGDHHSSAYTLKYEHKSNSMFDIKPFPNDPLDDMDEIL